ncbi:hypothetical protein C8F01DRAFT_1140975 [Mycena amicta]|nr:hypothetical protein C8F01DRAFT_1140975 [Mycena amicta]
MDSYPEPILPPELECSIFEMAALSQPTCIPQLVLVAKRVKQWTEPLLYRTLVFPTGEFPPIKGIPECDMKIFRRIVKTKGPEFLHSAVKNIMAPALRASGIRKILTACTGVENLYHIWLDNNFLLAVSPSQSSEDGEEPSPPPLRHLHFHLHSFYTDFACLPSLVHLTHLELVGGLRGEPHSPPAEGYRRILTLPSLTHLALNDHPSYELCAEILLPNTTLEAFVFLISYEDPPEPCPLTDDPRFIVMVVPEYCDDWQYGCLTGDDYWSRADAHIEKRKSGHVSRSMYVLRK